MKRIFSAILCFVMLFGSSIPASALIVDGSEIDDSNTTQNNSTLLTYTNEASYEIVIPANATVEKETNKGQIIIDITATNLADDQVVSVAVASDNYANDSWNLIDTKNSTNKISYKVGTTDGANDVASGDEVVSSNVVCSTTLYVELVDSPKVGTFNDTLTFTSEIVDLISFSVEGVTYHAKEGMTWEQFIHSKYNPNYDCYDGNKKFEEADGVGYRNQVLYHEYNICADGDYFRVSVFEHNEYDDEGSWELVLQSEEIIANEAYKSDNP